MPPRRATWRLWVGLGLTAAALAVTLRGVELRALAEPLRRVSAGSLALLVALHALQVAVRAERWHRLSGRADDALARPVAFRATAIGFMAINLFPLRMGEIVRPWAAARLSGHAFSRLLGSAVADRTLDFAAVSLAGAIVLLMYATALPGWMASGVAVFAGLAALPVSLVVALLLREDVTRRGLSALTRLLPARLREPAARGLDELCDGLSALKQPRRLAWGVLYTVVLWGLVIPGTFAAAFVALDIALVPAELALASFTTMVAVALAVAAPSAPGFFGLYHVACREALGLFGVPTATAVAYGTLAHATYWVPLTLLGLGCLAATPLRLGELWRAAPQPGGPAGGGPDR